MENLVFKTNKDEIDRLCAMSNLRIRNYDLDFVRYLEVDAEDRFVSIRGARGCGKTTFLHQLIKLRHTLDASVIYVNLDDVYFSHHRLIDFVEDFVLMGGKYLFLDEVHKYPGWSKELKTIYDNYSRLKIVFTSSSILEVYKGEADLSRRLVNYNMEGLSFREFLEFEHGLKFPKLSIAEILKNHVEICNDITAKTKIIPAFRDYLSFGFYPYFKESKKKYHEKLVNTVKLILEIDLPASIKKIEYENVFKLRKLLMYLAMNGPYKPDITKLSGQLEISRNSTLLFLNYLESAKMVNLLKNDKNNESIYTKPEKVLLHNTNLVHALGADIHNIGAIREIFFFNQLQVVAKVRHTPIGDFLINDELYFEIGGRRKSFEQLKASPNGYVAADDIEVGMGSKIPLWLFGFLY